MLLAVVVCMLVSLPLDVAESLALTAEEVTDLAGPGARILAKSNISAKARTTLVNSSDYVALGTVLTGYVIRILSEIKGRSEDVDTRQVTSIPPANYDTREAASGPTAPSGNGTYRASGPNVAALASFGGFSAI